MDVWATDTRQLPHDNVPALCSHLPETFMALHNNTLDLQTTYLPCSLQFLAALQAENATEGDPNSITRSNVEINICIPFQRDLPIKLPTMTKLLGECAVPK